MKPLLAVSVCALIAWGQSVSADLAPLTQTHGINMSEAKISIPQSLIIVNITERQIRNFWRRVDKNGPMHPYDPSKGKCWDWVGGKCSGGYGCCWVDGKTRGAHRVSLFIQGVELNPNLDTLHSCDRRQCVNPHHITQGTTSDNIQEAITRGRHIAPSGEKSGMSKLTEEKILEMRRLFSEGATKLGLSKQFGVARSVVFSIIKRQTWRHI